MSATKIDLDIANRIASPDIIAQDVKGEIILLGEVKALRKAGRPVRDRLINLLQAAKILIPFATSVDLEDINIFKWDGANLSEPV